MIFSPDGLRSHGAPSSQSFPPTITLRSPQGPPPPPPEWHQTDHNDDRRPFPTSTTSLDDSPTTSASSAATSSLDESSAMSTSSIVTASTAPEESNVGLSRSTIIILGTVIPAAVLLFAVLGYFLLTRRRRFRLMKRGITPIDDEEIESWRTEKIQEKDFGAVEPKESIESPRRHQSVPSTSSIQKPPSVIVYGRDAPYSARPSIDRSRGYGRPSADLAAPVQAVAPNARVGLTDDTVEGDVAYVPQIKRQPSRLAKSAPSTPSLRHSHSRSSLSYNSTWQSYASDGTPMPGRHSSDRRPRMPPPQSYRAHARLHSSSSNLPRPSQDDDMDDFAGGLSPRPLLRSSDIGRAIG